MGILLKSNDLLILRDGHPFGDIGIIEGYSKTWPLSQTLTGMIRTKIGLSKSEDYFRDKENCEKILEYGIKNQIPVIEDNTFLAPVPSDIIFSQTEQECAIQANVPSLRTVNENYGTDIKNKDWLIPFLNLKDKPIKEKPFFLKWNTFMKYLECGIDQKRGSFYSFGVSAPISEIRFHNAVNPDTYTTTEGQLFTNQGIYLCVKTEKNEFANINLLMNLIDNEETLNIEGIAYLGGERKTVLLEKSELYFPQCPKFFKNKQYLKFILSTHGDFGNWCPEWLMPDLNASTIPWTEIPGTNIKVRLRSSFVNGFDFVSGWDYVTKSPKPSKKLILPGSVYVIELQNPEASQEVAELLWGNFLDPNNKSASLNGYGQVFVGNILIDNNKK